MILVTGATGLVGSQIVRALVKQGKQVRALKRASSDLSLLGDAAQKVDWAMGDVTDVFSLVDAMQGVAQVYHCAAVISFHPKEVAYMMHVNVEGTANVVNSCLETGVHKLTHFSSVAAFGRMQATGQVIDENLDIKDSPENYHYFRSKLHGEREVWRGIAEGLTAAIICPSTILGGGFWHQQPNKLFAQIDAGYPFYSTGTNGFVDVRDVVELSIRLMESDIHSEKFIVSAENLAFKEVMWQIADSLQVKRASFKASKVLGDLAWRVEALWSLISGKNPLVTKEVVTLAQEDYCYNSHKIRQSFNFQFREISETIKHTALLYLQSKEAGKNFAYFE